MKTGRTVTLIMLLAWAVLAAVYGRALLGHARKAADPNILHDDARHWVAPFFRYSDPDAFPHDYIVDYHLAASPVGHRTVYRATARWVDPAVFSNVLAFVHFGILLLSLAWCACRIGGSACAWSACALVLSGYLYFQRMAGGTARSWAFPLVGLAAVSLVSGRTAWLPALALAGSVLYPPIGALLWVTVFLVEVALWLRGGADRSRLLRRTGIALVALAVSIAVVFTTRPSDYGRQLGESDVADYPEWGEQGRYGFDDRPPYINVLAGVGDSFARGLQGDNPAWVPALRSRIMEDSVYGRPSIPLIVVSALIGLITVVGSFMLARRNAAVRRLYWLLAASVLMYVAAQLTAPLLYHAQRYVIYSVPILALILFPVAVRELSERVLKLPSSLLPVSVLIATVLVLLLLGGRGGGAGALEYDTTPQQALYESMKRLPNDVVIAGWPKGVMDNVPWLTRRSALLTKESHDVIHQAYTDEMRKRMNALIDAYFADRPEPLIRLRDEFGVTHLLIERKHFEGKAPRYFEPFNARAKKEHRRMRKNGSEALRREESAAVYRDDAFILLDLNEL